MSSDRRPVCDAAFWRERLERARASGELWRAIFDEPREKWDAALAAHAKILPHLVHPYQRCRVLDAGCGYGVLRPLLPEDCEYTGVDLSPDLVKEAEAYRVQKGDRFLVADLRKLPFADRSFDLAVCRSVEGMICDNLGPATWRLMEREILRVADRLVLLSFGEPETYKVVDAVPGDAERLVTLESDGARLTYRAGQDGTVEFYDLYTLEHYRRRGAASRLVGRVVRETYGTVYGYCRAGNGPVLAMYQKLGFTLTRVPGFYRGEDAVMVHKPFGRKP